MRIGLLSDTHGYLDPKILNHFKECDEIWHAGDFGTAALSDELSSFKKLRGVYGNIDGNEIRLMHPVIQMFTCEGLLVFMTHIGGYPGHYFPGIEQKIKSEKPGLFISGHSHILKVIPDNKNELLHMNPGAAGKHGFHKFRTILRFTVSEKKISDLEVIQLGARATIDTLP